MGAGTAGAGVAGGVGVVAIWSFLEETASLVSDGDDVASVGGASCAGEVVGGAAVFVGKLGDGSSAAFGGAGEDFVLCAVPVFDGLADHPRLVIP